jgi:phosphonate transport system substrate-binding protein
MKWWMVLFCVVLAACGKSADSVYQPTLGARGEAALVTYRVGIHPLHNPQRLMEVYGPIIDHIDAAMPDVELRLEASRNYEEFERKLYNGYFDFVLPNPYQTVLAIRQGYQVFGKMADDTEFRGLILLRRDSPVRTVADLKGQKVAYPAPTALAATLLPQHYLHTHGLDVNRDIDNMYVGSQESAIVNVQRGHVAAAATWPVPWKKFLVEQPELASQLAVKWETPPLVNNSWMARRDVPLPLVRRFADLLFGLKDSEAGREMLQRVPVTAFEPASDRTYRPVQAFLDRFASTVRPIPH